MTTSIGTLDTTWAIPFYPRVRFVAEFGPRPPEWWQSLPWPQIIMVVVLLVIVVALLRWRSDEQIQMED